MAKKAKEKVESSGLTENMDDINKQYGEGTIIKLGESTHVDVEVIPTGSIRLDRALGVGGLPRGRIVDCYGAPSSGKSTLCLHVIANAQKKGYRCAYIDHEFAFDRPWAETLGVNTSELLFSQPDFCEEGLDIVNKLVQSREVQVIVVDSAAAMVPKAEQEADFGQAPMAIQARLMSQAMRKLVGPVSHNNVLLIFINQIRASLNTMGYGPSETVTSGNALKFYSSVRLDVRRIGALKQGEDVIGNRTRVKVVKNKVASPYQEAEFDLVYGVGIDKIGEIIDLAVESDIIQKAGAWYSMGETRLGQGKENTKDFLDLNPDLYQEIYDKIMGAQS